ncbi:MAG: hypothetical protein ACTHOK_12920 [Nocardioidaceae bacterium]
MLSDDAEDWLKAALGRHGWRLGTRTTETLSAADVGCWLVRTRGSAHVWDLDEGRYVRMPGPTAAPMLFDHQPVALGRVEWWPSVGGRSFLWYDDPDPARAPVLEHYRISSTIASITGLVQLPV